MLNRNKQDINSYVNSVDLERYLGYLRFDYPFIYRHSELPWDVNDMFRGNNTHAIILLHDDHPSGVGHYVCLRKDAVDGSGVEYFTWFDCLGDPMPQTVVERFRKQSVVSFLDKPLMSKTENLCGKYCIAFVNAGNIELSLFEKLLSSSKYSPDQLVANLYRLNYGDNVH